MTAKELAKIKKILDRKHIEYTIDTKFITDENGEEYEASDDFGVWVKACALGDNFYDYGEDERPLVIDDPEVEYIIKEYPNDFFVEICAYCCACAGW